MILLPGGQGEGPSDKYPIYARSGWRIPTERVREMDPSLIRIRAQQLQEWHPRAVMRSIPDYPYNCVGMIFAARRAWIEIDHLYDVLREDGYTRISRDKIVAGDVAVYRNSVETSHVGLILVVDMIGTVQNIRVLSKWGRDPEFIHFLEDVPKTMGSPVEYWTERA